MGFAPRVPSPAAAAALVQQWRQPRLILPPGATGIEVDEEVVLMTTKGEAIAVGIAQVCASSCCCLCCPTAAAAQQLLPRGCAVTPSNL